MAENGLNRRDGCQSPADGLSYDLHGVVVERESGPTRCTIYPRHIAPDERTTTWLSADHSAFYDVEEIR